MKKLGAMADLDAAIPRRQEEQQNPFAAILLMYWRAMLSGKGKPGPLENARYTAVQPIGVRTYAARIAAGEP